MGCQCTHFVGHGWFNLTWKISCWSWRTTLDHQHLHCPRLGGAFYSECAASLHRCVGVFPDVFPSFLDYVHVGGTLAKEEPRVSHFGTPFALFCPDHCLWHLWLGIPWKATWISLLSEWADLFYHHEFHHQALRIYDIGRNPIQWISRSPAHDACEYSNVLQASRELWRPDTSSFRLTKSSFGSSLVSFWKKVSRISREHHLHVSLKLLQIDTSIQFNLPFPEPF